MAQYIDKDALVAEIERRYSTNLIGNHSSFRNGKCEALREALSFIDTLEVKEVDINKEISQFIDANFEKATIGHKLSLRRTAKYFFELGIKAQKDNIRHSMDETPNYPSDILLVTNVDNIFLFKYMENGRPVDRETPYFHNIQNGKCWYYCNDIMNIH